MKITERKVTIREISAGYIDNQENGVLGLNGNLDIRPPFQREFVYKDKQRDAVIRTVLGGFPLNVMYWNVKQKSDNPDEPTQYEVLDGQQRTISICQYINNEFSIDEKTFYSQPDDIQQRILDYQLHIYECKGTESEKLEWFRVINTAGEKLNEQELRNAVYVGPWLASAKKYFSKIGCIASKISDGLVSGSANRQDILETALDWISDGHIEEYMDKHSQDENCSELRNYFAAVMDWVKRIFPSYTKYKKFTKGLPWGKLYNKYKDVNYDVEKLEARIVELMKDDEVQNKKGIFAYLLGDGEKHLNLRAFTDNEKIAAFERQQGVCPHCKETFEYEQMEGDHIVPWTSGGKTDPTNLQMLCRECNRKKSSN